MRLYPNPSHLEYVDPVVTGATRAAQTTQADGRIEHDPMAAVPVLLHGDAAFPAQGVVAETLNLQSLKGYATGGTVHIIQNNQIGFTTDPEEGRSTPYAADMAKGFNVPIIHVNADDPESCVAAVRLAMAYRERWGRDVVIDLIGYRRFGHNETDEPAYTQPLMAAKIKEHPPVSQLYAEELVKEGIVTPDEVEERNDERQKVLKAAHDDLRQKIESGEYADPTATGTGELDRTRSPSVETAVPEEKLRKLNEELLRVPDSFTIHRKLRKPLSKRLDAMNDGGIEFGHAEELALASLFTEDVHVRFTGQDTERGTFSNRHLVLHDEKTGLRYAPIQNLPEANAPLELHNSPLSESACLGFEYGYSAHSPDSLVLWEAQFGDFGNAAQVIIDSFIVSAEAKWGQTSRLTLLLPHGYEGAGPEHSSARIERFIQLAAEGNIRIANPSTAGQYFHLLRRQAHIAEGEADGRLHSQGPPPPAARDLHARGPHLGILPVRARRPPCRGTARRRSSVSRSAAARSTTTSTRRRSGRRPRTSRSREPSSSIPFAKEQLTELIEQLSEPEGDRLGPGGAAQHGRLVGHAAAHARAAARGRRARLRRPPAARQPRRGLRGRAHEGAGADRADDADGPRGPGLAPALPGRDPAAVHVDHLAGDVTGSVRSQEQDGLGDLLRLAETPQRVHGDGLVDVLGRDSPLGLPFP